MTAEIGRRATAARRGRRQCGRFWKAKVPKRVKRLTFISFVQGAALSVLTSMVLEPRHCAHLDRVLLGMPEESVWTARQTWRGTRQKNAKHVFRSWASLQAADELQVRRVRWYQSWARDWKDHHVVVTAVLGTCKVEEIVGVQRLSGEGNVCLSSTPMARQMADDIRKMSQLSEEVDQHAGKE